jgi:hypothetical protein
MSRNRLPSSLSWGWGVPAALLLFNLALIHAHDDDDDENTGISKVLDIFVLICGICFYLLGTNKTCDAVLNLTGLVLLACFGEDVTPDQIVLRVLPCWPFFAVPKDEYCISFVRLIVLFLIFAPSMVFGGFSMTMSLSDLLSVSLGRALKIVVLLLTPVTLWVLYIKYREMFLNGGNTQETLPTNSEHDCSTTLDDPSSSVPLNSDLADVGEAEKEVDIGEASIL